MLGTLAVLHSLERTRSGAYELAQCHTFAECEQAMAEGTMQQLLLPTDSLFTDRPAVSLTDEGRRAHCERCSCVSAPDRQSAGDRRYHLPCVPSG